MKFLITIALIVFISCNDDAKTTTTTENKTSDSTNAVPRQALGKLNWINGNWKGLYEGKSFYESYQLVGDTLLLITSYELNGRDTSKTSLSKVQWQDGNYYLGDAQNWKVTSITEREIKMLPNNKASNDITWTFQDSSTWVAVLRSPAATSTYIMQRQPPIDSLINKK